MATVLMEKLEAQARANPQKIAFPESSNEMILRAAAEVAKRNIGHPLLIGDPRRIAEMAENVGIFTEGFSYFDNTDEARRSALASRFCARFDTISEKAVLRKAKDSLNAAMLLCKLDEVDGVAAGREYTTADVLNAAISIVGLRQDMDTVSSLGILNIPGYKGPQGPLLAIADCAVNPLPDAKGLADIAISSAATVEQLLGWEPRVAMLSFSTCGSASHESIDVILEAIRIARQRNPALKIDGEFQLDAALVPKAAQSKVGRESEVAGRANVLIFPNLHAGNIGVKLVQFFAHGDAYGPVLQGFARPLCDFSRSAPLSEMMGNIVMLCVRAAAGKECEHV